MRQVLPNKKVKRLLRKLNKIPTQNQTSEASKGQSSLSQKENVSSVVQTNFAQKQHTSSKANQSAKVHKVAKQTNQRYQILVM